MFHSKVHIEAGDLVILFMVRSEMVALTVTPGEILHNKFGRYRHEDMIGMKYGSKMHSPAPQSGYVYLLRPTPELWTLSLPHRTQILYMTDIAYIIMRLGVRAGGKVIEAGTGSGSMTHSLSRAVGGKGYVGSYEYHASRCEKAKAEFEEHGLTNVRLQHRNVCKDGFGEVDNVEAVFLDLPAPWEAIPHAIKTLRPDVITKICCFSPCLEQVLKTVSTLREYGFSDISTQEVLIRTHELQPPPLPGANHLRSIDDIVTDLQAHEKKKEERRLFQMRTAREKAQRIRTEKGLAADPGGVNLAMELGDMLREELTKYEEPAVEGDAEMAEEDMTKKRKAEELSVGAGDDVPTKKSKPDQPTNTIPAPALAPAAPASAAEPTPALKPAATTSAPARKTNRPGVTLSSQVLLRIQPEMRGHTSYLTFATFHPASIREAVASQSVRSTKPSTPVPTPAPAPAPAAPAAKGAALDGTSKDKAILVPSISTASVVDTEVTETEYGDPALEEAIGTMTEEEMIALMG